MPYPQNPTSVVVKNNYYSLGLTELQIWNHYQKYKKQIVNEIDLRFILLFIVPKLNDTIVKRKTKYGYLTLDKFNYDYVVSGRTLSIAVERELMTNYMIIDIDKGNNVNEQDMKNCVSELLNDKDFTKAANSHKIVNSAEGYHVYFYLKKDFPLNEVYDWINDNLNKYSDKYVLGGNPPPPGKIKLDTSPARYRGAHTVINALCRNGLMAMEISNLKQFKRTDAIIK
jgi:hypothetical protein